MSVDRFGTEVLETNVCWQFLRDSEVGRLAVSITDHPDQGDAWSVVVKGHASEIERMQDVFDALDLPLFPWHASPKHRFVRIEPSDVSGRRFHVVQPEKRGSS
jgi:uncharacterized protein